MVKTQSSNFDAEWRNGNDSEMRCESLAGTSPGMDGSLLRRPCSVGHGRSLPHSRLPVALQASEEGASPLGVPPDLQSGVKKGSTYFLRICNPHNQALIYLKICIKKYSAKG